LDALTTPEHASFGTRNQVVSTLVGCAVNSSVRFPRQTQMRNLIATL
jgi:hypothetical protein